MKKKYISIFLDNLKTLFFALLIAVIIRSLFFQPFYIPSSSMEPTLLIGDRIFVNKYSFLVPKKQIYAPGRSHLTQSVAQAFCVGTDFVLFLSFLPCSFVCLFVRLAWRSPACSGLELRRSGSFVPQTALGCMDSGGFGREPVFDFHCRATGANPIFAWKTCGF